MRKLNRAWLAGRQLGKKMAVAAAAVLLSACAAKQINTQAFVEVPVPVPRLLIVYQPSESASTDATAPAAHRQAERERINDLLGDSMEERLPSGLAAAGINALFVRAASVTTVLNSRAARSAVSHVLYLRLQEDREDCGGSGACSHRVTVRATLLRSGAAPTLWRTDLQEAYFVSSSLDRPRFDDLADHVVKAVAPMIKAAPPLSEKEEAGG